MYLSYMRACKTLGAQRLTISGGRTLILSQMGYYRIMTSCSHYKYMYCRNMMFLCDTINGQAKNVFISSDYGWGNESISLLFVRI